MTGLDNEDDDNENVSVRTYYLIASGLDAFDLQATAAQMQQRGFTVRLETDAALQALRVHHRPAQEPSASALAQAPEATHELRFVRLLPQTRQDITGQLEEDGESVPPLLLTDALVLKLVQDTDQVPVSTVSLLWTLLAELVATAPNGSRVTLYDPEWNVCLAQDNVREYMDWQDILEEIAMDKEPLTIFGKEKLRKELEKVEKEREKEALKAEKAARKAAGKTGDASPGEQRDGLGSIGWIVVAALAAAAGWFWFAGR